MRAALLSCLLLVSLPLAAADPGAESAPDETVLIVTPVEQKLVLAVPKTGPVSLLLEVERGAVAEILLDGPGTCDGAVTGPKVGASMLLETLEIKCGTLHVADYTFGVSARGVARISLAARGATVGDSPLDTPLGQDDP